MESDIKLDGSFTVVEGAALVSRTWDIILDAPDRRVKPDGMRRALVHSSDDALIINFEGDYPGGVTIAGKTNLATISASSKLEINPPKPSQPAPQPSNSGVVEQVPQIPGLDFGRVITALEDVFLQIEKSKDKSTTNLASEISRLREAVLQLNERLKRLEGS